MKRRGMLVIALAGLTALLGSCGGGDEAGVLAVAFRLDEGSPVMSAYIGDPAKDPFLLPAGRYYIEALDQDDVVVSLGAVDIKPGDAVDIPPSSAAAGGAADAEHAESLVTMANFLVDVQLSKYTLLEIVSGGFEQPLFDPDVEVAAADLEALFGIYEGILAQEDGIMAALAEIERRAEVSLGPWYVRSGWAPAPQDPEEDLQKARGRVSAFCVLLKYLKARGISEDAIAESFVHLAEQQNVLEAQMADPTDKLIKSPELAEKYKKWREYAQDLAMKIPTAEEEAGRQQARQELAGAIRKDLEDWLDRRGAEVTAKQIENCADSLVWDVFVNLVQEGEPAWIGGYVGAMYDQWLAMGYNDLEVDEAVYNLRECLTKEVAAGASQADALAACHFWDYQPSGTRIPDTSWIEGYVQVIGEQWVDEGYGVEAVVATEMLKDCLTKAVEAGASRDEAIAKCPAETFKPKVTPEATQTPTPEPTETPTPEPTETPTPQETETPAPTASPTPSPTALNRLTDLQVSLGIVGEGDEPGTVGVVVTVGVYFELGEEDATVTCTSQSQLSGVSLAVHRPEAYASVELGRDDVRPGQDYTVTCSISDGNSLSTTVKLPEATETPAPPGVQVTATGGFDIDPDYFTVTENTMTLTFNTGGGLVTGDSRLHYEQQQGSIYLGCGMDLYDETTHYEGTNSLEDPRVFSGTATYTYAYDLWYVEGEGDQTTCVQKHTGSTVTLSWNATWEGGVVTGWTGSRDFQLTVGSQ